MLLPWLNVLQGALHETLSLDGFWLVSNRREYGFESRRWHDCSDTVPGFFDVLLQSSNWVL